MKIVINNPTKYILDILLFISGFVTLVASYVLWFIIPRGVGIHGGDSHCSGSGVGATGNVKYVMGFPRFTWISFHNWVSVVLFIIVVIHIIIHWRWIVEITRKVSNNLQGSAIKVLELYGSVVILFILFVFDSLSGLVIWLVLPRGKWDYFPMINGYGRTFLSLQRDIWVDLHAWKRGIDRLDYFRSPDPQLEMGGGSFQKNIIWVRKVKKLKSRNALKDASLHFGIIGALAFVVFVLIFGEDWTHRYHYLSYLTPLPVISLIIANWRPLLGGLLLMATGIGTVIFDIYFSPGYPGQVAGRGLGYTLVFVSMPLVISGLFYLILWWNSR